MAVRPEDFGAVLAGSEPAKPQAAMRPEDFGATPEPGLMDKVKDLFTGELRRTRETDAGGFYLPDEDEQGDTFQRRFKVAAGLMSTQDPQRRMAIISEAFPGVVFDKDEKGNFIVDARAIGGTRGPLDQPGADLRNLIEFGGLMAAFLPAGKVGAAGAGVLSGAARGGAMAAGTQAGILDPLAQAAGGTNYQEGETPGVQAADINLVDVGLAGAGGAGGEVIARGLGALVPALRATQTLPIDRSVKDAAAVALKNAARYQEQFGAMPSKQQMLEMFAAEGVDDVIAEQILAGVPAIKAAEQSAASAAAQSQRFRIPYTSGQTTGSPRQLQFEESVVRGGKEAEAQSVADSFQRFQNTAIAEAVRREAGVGTQAPLVSTTSEAAEEAIGAVRTAAQRLDESVKAAYDEVPKGSYYKPDAVRGLTRAMNRSVIGTEFDRSLPGTAKALSDLAKMDKAMRVLEKNNARVPFETVEKYRRRLMGYMKGKDVSPSDLRQLTLMKQSLDDYVDRAVADGLLFGGDDAAQTLSKIENARSIRRRYSELFEPQARRTKAGVLDSDNAGRLINTMAELEPSSDEVVTALFGSGKLFGKKGSAELASRIKQAIGSDSPEWQQLKQAAFLKIFGVDKGQLFESAGEGTIKIEGGHVLRTLQDVLGGRGKNLANEFFTKEEIGRMVDLARAIKRAQPTPFNPSGTAGQIESQMGPALRKLMSIMAFDGGLVSGLLVNATEKGAASLSKKQLQQLVQQSFSGRPLQRVVSKVPGEEIAGATVIQQTPRSDENR